MIRWPCIMKLEGDNELLYFKTEDELSNECVSLILSSNDRLIDSAGNSYKININSHGNYDYITATQRYSIDDVTHLIKAHEFSKAETCLTKIQFPSVSEAIKSLSMSE